MQAPLPLYYPRGSKIIMGTKWTIENKVEYCNRDESKPWLVTFGLCKGTSDRAERFATKTAAIEAATN